MTGPLCINKRLQCLHGARAQNSTPRRARDTTHTKTLSAQRRGINTGETTHTHINAMLHCAPQHTPLVCSITSFSCFPGRFRRKKRKIGPVPCLCGPGRAFLFLEFPTVTCFCPHTPHTSPTPHLVFYRRRKLRHLTTDLEKKSTGG